MEWSHWIESADGKTYKGTLAAVSTTDNADADAALIAASPDLLAAAIGAAHFLMIAQIEDERADEAYHQLSTAIKTALNASPATPLFAAIAQGDYID